MNGTWRVLTLVATVLIAQLWILGSPTAVLGQDVPPAQETPAVPAMPETQPPPEPPATTEVTGGEVDGSSVATSGALGNPEGIPVAPDGEVASPEPVDENTGWGGYEPAAENAGVAGQDPGSGPAAATGTAPEPENGSSAPGPGAGRPALQDAGRVLANPLPVRPLDRPQAARVVQGSLDFTVAPDGSSAEIAASGTLPSNAAGGIEATASGSATIAGEQSRGNANVAVSTAAGGGAQLNAAVNAGPEVNKDKPTKVTLEGMVGNEITGPAAFNSGYQSAVQTILTRQRPGEANLPEKVRTGLETVGKLNKDGKLDGAVQIHVDKSHAVSQAVAGAQQGIVDTPFLRVFQRTGRPGFVGIRSRIAQRAEPRLASAASQQIDRLQGQATAASNGVVTFDNGPVARTGVGINVSSPGVDARVSASVNDFHTFRNTARGWRRR
ncbi:MAG: hypothetical protein HY815_05685 [Candidatus Riflebacteria bacterium]|nr:hypothetical protein [Candidatus Riflebacteria bacterium]